ncbi:ANTAR domain-containing protein [Streptomyces sp. NPDC021093]|uniref:ANTAR domain-containing protein n=1 Tax=Streptomyces sp. NPDC021093 TaxID=3365112 RepID=UPI0037A9ECA5
MTTSAQRVARTFVTIAEAIGALDDSHDVLTFLTMLADSTVGLLDVHAAAVFLAPAGTRPARVAASDPQAETLVRLAVDWQEGPGPDCLRGGASLDVPLDGPPADARWPRYAPEARERGYARAGAIPLRQGDEVVGALVLLCTDPHALASGVLALGRCLADAAAISVLRERELSASRVRTAQLEQALTSRLVIEQAKGILAARLALPMDEAFAVLRGHARAHQRKIHDTARDVVEGRLRPGPPSALNRPSAR